MRNALRANLEGAAYPSTPVMRLAGVQRNPQTSSAGGVECGRVRQRIGKLVFEAGRVKAHDPLFQKAGRHLCQANIVGRVVGPHGRRPGAER